MTLSYIYAVVNNIPSVYHSSDLRNFFSQFVETSGFECFHFRHRPEIQKRKYCMNNLSSTNSSRPNFTPIDSNSTNSTSKGTSRVNREAVFKFPTAGQNCTETRPIISSCTTASTSNLTYCCVVKIRSSRYQELMKLYHRKHWIDRNGHTLPIRCFISRVRINAENLDLSSDNDNDSDIISSDVERCTSFNGTYSGNEEESRKFCKTRAEEVTVPDDGECCNVTDLDKLKEFHPPPVMPHGNVGTPTRIFLELIRNCKLPPSIITKLGLEFPKTRGKRLYGSVPFEYDIQLYRKFGVSHRDFEPARTAKGNVIMEVVTSSVSVNQKDFDVQDVENTSDKESEEDDDTCEEWERHEALHNDVTQCSRERLFEEEIELKWEKGGSGLVFYTDAQYWDAREGDFDERTADDWDVDMAGYYEPGAGDKDARDFLQMRSETRLRNGIEDDVDFNRRIGFFENHTKGIGRRLMEKQGWRDGQGLGKTVIGPAEPVVDKGQNPRNKSGFGYRGEKLVRRPGSRVRKRQRSGDVFISTVYDNPYETDHIEPLLRSSLPSVLSFRKEFMKSSDNQ